MRLLKRSRFLGGSPQQPTPPKFKPTDITQAGNLFAQYNTIGYNLADQDFLSRFPSLVAQRDQNIKDTVNQIEGPLDPAVQNSFATSSLAGALSSFGGTSGSNVGSAGSAARGSIAAGITQQTNAYQDNARSQLQQLLADNPQRALSMGGDDALNLLIGNTVGRNQANYQAYAGQLGASNAANASQTQQLYAGAGLAVSLIGIAASI